MGNAKSIDQSSVLKVLISGGGPVGLSLALLLEDLMGTHVAIKIYDGRWEKEDSCIVWKSTESGNARRQQVVTIQSRQYLQYPQAILDRIFQTGHYSEMWPEGPDSIRGYPPRNIRIAYLEDQLLEIANEKTNIELIPTWFKVKEKHNEMQDHDILAICEGGQSRSREFFIDKFGTASKSMYSIGEEHLQDVVLGLRVKSDLSNPMSVLLTVAQNRFLLNSLNGEGFLNMRLTDNEVKEVVGIDVNGQHLNLKVCIQSQPCLMEMDNSSEDFACPTHGTLFLPALLKASPLWTRIKEGLKLFSVKLENLTAITAFRLDMVQRPRFSVRLYPPMTSTSATYGFLLGDAANALHFWSGRGLNNGIASVVSLARCLKQKWQAKPFREADFTRHEGVMSMLQYRHKSRAWQTMTETDEQGKTIAIKHIIADAITIAEEGETNKQVDIDTLMRRLIQIRQRLKQRLNNLPDDEVLKKHLSHLDAKTLKVLVMSHSWNTALVGGEEVDINLLFSEPYHHINAIAAIKSNVISIENSISEENTILASLVYKKESDQAINLMPKLDIRYDSKSAKIGRNKQWSDLHLDDISISRKHALIILSNTQDLFIQDHRSTGGTYVNQQQLSPNMIKKLRHDDEISFSGYITYTVKFY